MVTKRRRLGAGIRPTTVALFGLTVLWAVFQWRDPTPPPVLDQILVGGFGFWFANEAIDRKKSSGNNDDDDEEEPPKRKRGQSRTNGQRPDPSEEADD